MGNPMTEEAMPPLPEPFIGVQDRPWGGHAEVIRSAIGEEGVIAVYTAEQLSDYARTYAADLERRLQEAGRWVPAGERFPEPGTMCAVVIRYTLDRPAFVGIDAWDVQREDPTGMGGQTIETGYGWDDNYEADVLYWMPIPALPSPIVDARDGAIPAAPSAAAGKE